MGKLAREEGNGMLHVYGLLSAGFPAGNDPDGVDNRMMGSTLLCL
jgi:hypothetical protein